MVVVESGADAVQAAFERLEKPVSRGGLASNTSSILIMKLGVVTSQPHHVLGIHFVNPVPVLPLVELAPSLLTAEDVTERSRVFVEDQLDEQSIDRQPGPGRARRQRPAHPLRAVCHPDMLELAFATAEDIDRGLVLGAALPQGPLALADLIGLDITKAVAESLSEEFRKPLYPPPPLLARMVDAGLLGRKAGREFCIYS